MRTVVRVLAFGLAAVATVLVAMVAFGITSEYGPTPNGGGAGEAVGWTAQFALPGVLVVLVLAYLGTVGMALGRRRRVVVGAAVATLVVVTLAVLAGSLSLTQRCAVLGAQHSAACPDHVDPS